MNRLSKSCGVANAARRFCQDLSSAFRRTPVRAVWLLLGALVLLVASAGAQQVARPDSIPIARPEFEYGKGPVIAIDGAHKNTHSYENRFHNFVRLLRGDGYRVRSQTVPISAVSLKGVDVLVLAKPGGWESADASLNDAEVAALLDWVRGGGSLLFILDHSPAPQFNQRVTRALGVEEWQDGFAVAETPEGYAYLMLFQPPSQETRPTVTRTPRNWLTYEGPDARLGDHPITRGRNPAEQIKSVVSIVGSAFRPPPGAEPLLILPKSTFSFEIAWLEKESRWDRIHPETPRTPVGGWAQAAVMKLGKGRVALFGEVGLFSSEEGGHPATAENRKFVLNVMRWLSGKL